MAELMFDEAAHRYTLAGGVLPSVTQILKPLYDFNGINPAMLQAKALLGQNVHRACELLDRDDLDEETDAGRAALAPIAGYLSGYKAFKTDMKPVIVENETRLFHPAHMYAGQLDRRYKIVGQVWDIDLKSTVAMSPIVALQTAAYTELLKVARSYCGKVRRGALQLFPNGKYKLHEFADPSDFTVFLSLLNIHRFKERNAL